MMNRATSELVGLNYFKPNAQKVSSEYSTAKTMVLKSWWQAACDSGNAEDCYRV